MIVLLESILGARVRDRDGRVIGRIEEVRCTTVGERCDVDTYLVGASGLVERLAAWSLIRPIRRILPRWLYRQYRIPAEALDLRDPRQPRTTMPARDLTTR
jgi:hypothetical protein